MKLYHRTTTEAVQSIMENGFKDSTGNWMMSESFAGVFFANRPLDCNEGTKEGGLLAIDIPDSILGSYEIEEEGKPYREFLIPAKLVNEYGPPLPFDEFDDEE
jgi:hypothetical protein